MTKTDPRTRFVQCEACRHIRLDEVGLCPECWTAGSGQEVVLEAIEGEIYSYTCVHPREGEPYWLAAINLDIGMRFIAPIVGNEIPTIGMRVCLTSASLAPVSEVMAKVFTEEDRGIV